MSKFRRQTLGRLACTIYDTTPGAVPERIVVFCHGFGASGEDLVPLGPEMDQQLPSELARTRFVFPAAPLSLRDMGIPGGRAWWPIDMAKLQMAAMQGRLRDLRHETPPELPAAREMLLEVIDTLRLESGLAMSQFVLGGFSQGAMLATDVTLQLTDRPAALLIFSGTLLCEQEWREKARNLSGLRVMQTHGTQDPILPFALAEELRELLASAGAVVEWVPFQGPHTISGPAMAAGGRLVASI